MIEQTQGFDGAVTARRRLIRGVFGAPAMLTLYSGSALAASSSQCLAKATLNSSTAQVITINTSPPSDTLLRVQLLLSGSDYYLAGAQVGTSFVRAGYGSTDIPIIGQWRKYDINLNKFAAGLTTTNPGGGLTDKWVALRFNPAGQLVGIGSRGTGSVVGGSCWTSLKA